MKKIKYCFVLAFILLGNFLAFAQWEDQDGPPSPDGLGKPASPIDMYWIVLATVAVVLIVMYAKKRKLA